MRRLHKQSFIVLATICLGLAGCQAKGGATSPPAAGAPVGTSSPPAVSASPAPTTAPSSSGGTNVAVSIKGPVTAVRLIDASSGWAAGNGWIARTDDGGKSWQAQQQTSGKVQQLFALNGNEAWAEVGETLLATTDGGKHWASAGKVPGEGFLHFDSAKEAFSANLHTTDGGRSWSKLPVPAGMVGDAYFHDAMNGWAVTQAGSKAEVKRTTDGGKSWSTVMSRPLEDALNGADIRSAGADDAWVEWIGGSGMTQTSYSLFHTSDGGKTWKTVVANATAGGGPAPGVTANETNSAAHNGGSKPGPLDVVSPQVAFLGGNCPACDKPNTIGWTKDGGATWTNGTAAYTGYGPALLAMADADKGWWVCTDNKDPSVLYTTADGGKTWTAVHSFKP